jgi:hypothetical protein
MKRLLSATTFCSALLLLSAAIPSRASTITFMSTLGAQGEIHTASLGPDATVLQLQAFFNSMAVAGAPSGNGTYSGLYLTETYTPDVLTVSGAVPSLNSNLSASTTLLTITFTSAGLNADTNTLDLNSPVDVSSITVSPTLLSDLGLSGASALTSLTDTGRGNIVNDTFKSYNPGLNLTMEVAEPRSLFMMALGLGLTVFGARGKYSRIG